MYYTESSALIEKNLLDKKEIKILDREIGHAYAPGPAGSFERSWMAHKTELSNDELDRLLSLYLDCKIIEKRESVECPCGKQYDVLDGTCIDCGTTIDEAVEVETEEYTVMKQPEMPAFDPEAQPNDPTVFISYRQNDTGKLAADIYYSLKAEGHSVFLDNGDIPAGADAERVFLRAASKATHFIALVSQNYFESAYCKKEFAHSARKKRRLLRVNIEPVPDPPNDMTWANAANWVKAKGIATGLTPELEAELLNDVKIKPPANLVDLRLSACEFLLNQLAAQELNRVWNQMGLHQTFVNAPGSKQEMITRILQESNGGKLDPLCDALAV